MDERIVLKPAQTPYDGSSKPFTIGLAQLKQDHWIAPDSDLAFYLAEKRALLASDRAAVFAAEPDTEPAQQELLDLLVEFLPRKHPSIYCRRGDSIEVAGQTFALTGEAPLVTAGLLVQDDFAIMRRKETGWHLVAAFIAFPSSWSLAEKYGRSMDEIHAPVPGFETGTRNAELISRMFDNLPPARFVERFNWAVNSEGALHLPKSKSEDAEAKSVELSEDSIFLRVERQTLRKLPKTGDIVFTIRIYSDPLAVLQARPDRAALASSLAAQLEALSPQEAAYKGLASKRKALFSALDKLSEG
ncbi:hypothetical protein QO002_003964 [Pararhizobium capsulatum DSM 1112]|uniref:DUF3445 domain-containing protein n=1 Tax=Pararhizobium capsulatum DSM 1112 TaxID=1121113 RepID=A0ABU0BU97_9HYPH|nr:DUF3445 domain-containing protein [Pararhizobium capsulatum]MDQ0321826.1 hypothetical protein [Pararhizobium capsulatum DSM 1112]